MTTLGDVLKSFVSESGGKVTADQIRRHLSAEYPDKWKGSTLQAQLYACAANNPKAYVHHPYTEKFLYRNPDGSFELYSEALHGPNEWAPSPGDDEVVTPVELEETTVSLERDIEDHLVHSLEKIEKGLKLVGRQVKTEVGRVDLLAEDSSGTRVIIELKVGEAKDSAVGQIARYIGWYAKTEGKQPRGLLIAASFSEGTQYAATAIPALQLLAYHIHFSFEKVDI